VPGKINKFPGVKNQQVVSGLQQLMWSPARCIDSMRVKITLKKEIVL
jgi:hypothetical protein